MEEQKILDALTNINIDSETAEIIMSQWIAFKYIDTILGFICCMTMVLGMGWLIWSIFKRTEGKA